MKNVVIAFLIVTIVVLVSFLYRFEKKRIYIDYPVEKIDKASDPYKIPFDLYIFFSKDNCKSCLEVIEVLNRLEPPFKVIGVVSPDELKDEKKLRLFTGASFQLLSSEKYKKYIPPYSPSIIGVSKDGLIYFVLPCIPGINEYIEEYLSSFYQRVWNLLINR